MWGKNRVLVANRATKNNSQRMRNLGLSSILAGIGVVLILLLGVWYINNRPAASGQAVQFPHIHGLGFSTDGSQLFVPAHDGFRIFEAGRWVIPDLPINDYMGYSPIDTGFYSSGHPQPRPSSINPLGLVKSTDRGQTLTTLDFEGESDFHLMAAGYKNHALYVFNPELNSKLSTGFHYSLDEGKTWQSMAAQGITGRPIQLAIHPTEAQTVALATEGGLYLSNDYGDTFSRISQTAPVTSVAFDPRGQRLIFGYQSLQSYNLDNGETNNISTPSLTGDDAIGYSAINPVSEQIAFATINLNIYFSGDNEQTWEQIAAQGIGRS